MPSVRAMRLARLDFSSIPMPNRAGRARFNALGAGDEARELPATGFFRSTAKVVSMPSVRAMRLARDCPSGRRRGTACFNALGAGDEARERAWARLNNNARTCFNALGAGDEAREWGGY